VHRVIAQHEVVIVRKQPSDDKLRVGLSLDLDGFVRRLEGRQVALPKRVGNRHCA